MNSKEMEARSGLTRSNIRFYEDEGLLHPQRKDNGYRDYSEEDLRQLLKIRLLRTVGLGLEEIRAIQEGTLPLYKALMDFQPVLDGESQQLCRRQALCEQLCRDGADYSTLDAQRYLQGLAQDAPTAPREDSVPLLQAPWQRLFARLFDLFLDQILLLLLIPLVLHTSPASQTGSGLVWLAGVLNVGLMFLLEPLLLHWWGTTPGKWLMGLQIRDEDGTKLSLSAAYTRTGCLLVYGLALGFPLVNIWRLWRSYSDCTDGLALPWDGSEVQTQRDSRLWRFALPLLCGALLVGLLLTAVRWSALPPHRGDLTQADFVENYNALAHFHELDTAGWRLGQDGTWEEIPNHELYISAHMDHPTVTFTEEDGCLVQVEFLQEYQDDYPVLALDEMQLAVLAYTLGRGGLFQQDELAAQLSDFIDQPSQSFSCTVLGVNIHWDVDMEGYLDAGTVLVPQEGKEDCRCSLRLTLSTS